MNRIYTKLVMLVGLFSLLITPNAAMASPAATNGIEFRIAYVGQTYEVYMRPNVDPDGPALTLTAQVTLKVPHGTDANRFQISELASGMAGTEWAETSRIDAPEESQNADYISLTIAFPTGDHQAFDWASGEEIKVFTFSNQGECLGNVELLSNDDAFVPDLKQGERNSANTNPGNQIDVLNMGWGNLFAGVYGSAASCGTRTIEEDFPIFLPIISN